MKQAQIIGTTVLESAACISCVRIKVCPDKRRPASWAGNCPPRRTGTAVEHQRESEADMTHSDRLERRHPEQREQSPLRSDRVGVASPIAIVAVDERNEVGVADDLWTSAATGPALTHIAEDLADLVMRTGFTHLVKLLTCILESCNFDFLL